MSIFSRLKQRDSNTNLTPEIDSSLAYVLLNNDQVTRDAAMSIPAVAACVNKICSTVASLEIKLYRRVDDTIEEITDDERTTRLNDSTGDTLTGFQMKQAVIRDMLLGKGGYIFINRVAGRVKSLHYVPCECISVYAGSDPIFKKYEIVVNGKKYPEYSFIKVLRNTQNGWSGHSIVLDSNKLFQIVVASQDFEKNMAVTGGAKRGFFKAQNTLSKEAMEKFREAYSHLYVKGSESTIVLNNGMDFKEISASSSELQLNENKTTNNNDICKIFGIPPSIINGGASKEDRRAFYEGCIYPILTTFAKSLNDVLLNPWSGEDDMFFAFDDTGLTRADIEERFNAYEKGIKSGFLQLDEVRAKENLPALGIDFVKLGLQDVLLNAETGNIYTPNMGVMSNIYNAKPQENLPDNEESEVNPDDEGTN